MSALTFDTLSTARRLREKGLPQEQAEAIADEIRMGTSLDLSHLATKADLRELELRLQNQIQGILLKLGGMIVALGGLLIGINYFG